MAYTYDELHKKTIAQLREIAAGIEHEAVQGYTQMNKEHLLPALCTALGIDTHEHHKVIGLDKKAVKATLKSLKKDRQQALDAHDRAKLKALRRRMHRLKRRIRAATV